MPARNHPSWFSPYVYENADQKHVTVHGARISFRESGDAPVRLLFVHGSRAHARWWTPVLSLLDDTRFSWSALDLSGHGDSDWRPEYDHADWTAEVRAVVDAIDGSGQVVVVGHSLGGLLAINASIAHPRIRLTVSVDGIPRASACHGRIRNVRKNHRARTFSTREEAILTFLHHPSKERWPMWMKEYVAGGSVRRQSRGQWSWAHDPTAWQAPRPPAPAFDGWKASKWSLIAGENSAHAQAPEMELVRRCGIPALELAGVGHDVMMEAPDAFLDALYELVGPGVAESWPSCEAAGGSRKT